MITSQRTIDIQFGDMTVGMGNSNGRLTLTGLFEAAKPGVVINDLIDYHQPMVCLHFPTAESVDAVIRNLQQIQDRLREREMSLELRAALDRELELAAIEELEDDDSAGCECCSDGLSDHTESEII